MDYIREIKEIVAEQAYEQLKHNLDKVNTKELGEVVDMIKDMAEAEYYCSVVEAMEEADEEAEKVRYYTPYYADMKKHHVEPDWDDQHMYMSGRRMYADYRDPKHHIPYYDYDEPVARDMREGRSPLTRRMYMESKEHHQGKEVQLRELEKYMGELSQDITEMIADATPEEKTMLHKKLAALTNKIELLKSENV